MATDAHNREALFRQIENLVIEVSQNSEGVLTACTHAEPYFCYDAGSIEELQTLVSETLTSYGRNFFQVEGLDIDARENPFSDGVIPVERSTPITRLTPVFDKAA